MDTSASHKLPGEKSKRIVQKAASKKYKQSTTLTALVSKKWFWVFSILFGLFVGLPFLAPILMEIGWQGGGKAIYLLYTFLCHQLPQRSFFLFGEQAMYELPTIQASYQNTLNPLILRQFIGNPEMGWKVAWSDRMVSMYSSILLWGWLWYPLRKKIKGLPLWGFVLLTFPLVLDGSSHLVSDFAGLGQGFRDSNAWLAAITGQRLPIYFYVGDGLGTFNSWMRLGSGILFGLGVAWFTFPILQASFNQTLLIVNQRRKQAGFQVD